MEAFYGESSAQWGIIERKREVHDKKTLKIVEEKRGNEADNYKERALFPQALSDLLLHRLSYLHRKTEKGIIQLWCYIHENITERE